VVFDVRVLHGRRVIPTFHFDKSGFLDRFLVVADPDVRVRQDVIVLKLGMNKRRSLFGRFYGIDHEGVFFVLNFQCSNRTIGGDIIFCDDSGDFVTIVPDVLVEKFSVSDISVFRNIGPRVSRCRERSIGDVETC